MVITPGGQNVVNENMSGRLKSKLMKPMSVVLGNVKINLCLYSVYLISLCCIRI